MAYAAHTLVTFGGDLIEASGQPNEIWQSGMRIDGVTDLAAYLDALAGDGTGDTGTIPQWWKVSANFNSTSARLQWVKVAAVTPTGQDPALTKNMNSPINGSTFPTYPNFVTVSYTMETADPKSHGGRGRCFVPNAFSFTGSSIDAGTAANAATAGVSLVDAMSGGGTLGAVPVVASRKYGTLKPIVAVSADCILDTQRRRRNNLLELRHTENV